MCIYAYMYTCIYVYIPRTGLSPFLPIHPLLRVSLHLATQNTILLPKYGYYAFLCFSPHLCVGFLFLILYPVFPRLPPPPAVTHHLSHTIFHTQLCHTPSFAHTTLSHTIFHTQLCHTHSFTHKFVTHTFFHTPSSSHTFFHTPFVLRGRRGTWRHPSSFRAAGVALGHHLRFARQASSFCVAGVALMALGWLWWRSWARFGRPCRRGTLRGRRGTWGHPPLFHVAGMALGDNHLRFVWQAWHLWHWAGSGGARLGPFWSPVTPRHFAWQAWPLATCAFVLRGKRGTWRQPPSFCVAGMTLMALGWLWWRAWARFGRR